MIITRKKNYMCFILLISCLFSLNLFAGNDKAREIMKKVIDRDTGDNSISDMEMILIDKYDKKRTRKMRMFSKKKGKDEKKIMFFLYPADVKGTGFLTYDYADYKKDDDQWIYLPGYKKVKRIVSSDRSSSFMGSDFNYSDMTKRDISDYKFKILKVDIINKKKCWRIEVTPVSKKVMVDNGYTKSIVWIRQDNYVRIRAAHWVYQSNRIRYMEIKTLKKIDSIWVPLHTQMKTKEGKTTVHTTVLIRKNVRFNQKLSDSYFNVASLPKGPRR